MQVCLFDLDYGLPVQVRDTALGIEKEEIPESDVGKEFQLNEQIQRGQTESAFGGGGRPNDMLQQLARTTPYYKVSWAAAQSGWHWDRGGRCGHDVCLCGLGCDCQQQLQRAWQHAPHQHAKLGK